MVQHRGLFWRGLRRVALALPLVWWLGQSAAPAMAQDREASSAACASSGIADHEWLATGGLAHPLIGRVLGGVVGSSSRADFDRALAAGLLLSANGSLLFGEVHDNPDHHALRGVLVRLLRCAGEQPKAAVFEHIRTDQQPALDQFVEFNANARRRGHSGDLLRFLEWDKGGWPAGKMFAPLFDAVIQGKLAILPGDPPRTKVRGLARREAGAIPDDERARLRLDEPMPDPLMAALSAELKGSHCGMLPDQAIPGMSAAQRYRDAHLADAMLGAVEKHGAAILFAGNGHVRSDRGVPWYIRQRKPEAKVVTVMFVEVEDGQSDPMAYVPRGPEGAAAVDYIVFTPRAERADPCERMSRAPKAGRG